MVLARRFLLAMRFSCDHLKELFGLHLQNDPNIHMKAFCFLLVFLIVCFSLGQLLKLGTRPFTLHCQTHNSSAFLTFQTSKPQHEQTHVNFQAFFIYCY